MRERTEKLAKLNLETEGLLALALKRGEETPEQVWLMIKEKAQESLEIIESLLEETVAAESEEEKGNAVQPFPEATPGEEPKQEAPAETTNHEAAVEAKTEETPEEEIEESEPDEKDLDENVAEPAAVEEAGAMATDEEPIYTAEAEIDAAAEDEAEAETTNIEADENSLIEAESENSAKDLRKFFTINDLFRFKRELFGNDSREFDESLEALSNMNAVPEAREYLRDKAGTNMGKDETKEFIAILRNYFKSKKGD